MELPQREFCRVITDYRSAYPDPIVLGVGDEVTIEDRESKWSGWIWCASRHGRSGWVPEKYVRRTGNSGAMLRDYAATELSVIKGDPLTIIDVESGWLWCRHEDGRLGWVPTEHVERMA